MENPLNITFLNDFIFCPASIYFHSLYDGIEHNLFQNKYQINGTKVHQTIDNKTYSGSASLQSFEVYCEKYNLIGKIDLYIKDKKILVERKKKIKRIYDGYIFQLYGQYFAMTEMGYQVDKLILYSLDDNKKYNIVLPHEDVDMMNKFEKIIKDINCFDLNNFIQSNEEKCNNCIYAAYCDKGI